MKFSEMYMAAVSGLLDAEGTFNVDRVPTSRVMAIRLGTAIAKTMLGELQAGRDYTVQCIAFYSRKGGHYSYFPLIRPASLGGFSHMVSSGFGRVMRNDMWCAGVHGEDIAHAWKNDRSVYGRGARVETAECDRLVSRAEPFFYRMATRALTPKEFRYDRAIGVEMECYGTVHTDTLAMSLPTWARAGQDGSIRPHGDASGHEVRALLVRREMEPRLWRLCQIMRGHDLKVNASCGLHIHLDQRGQTYQQVTKRAKIMDAWLHQLQELVPASRRTNNFCRFGISATDRYRAVNLTAFAKYQTLEIRLHSGTVDYTKILSWIRLLELLAALPKKPKAGGCIATLEQLPLASHDLAFWRSRHQELNPSLYSNSGATTEQEN